MTPYQIASIAAQVYNGESKTAIDTAIRLLTMSQEACNRLPEPVTKKHDALTIALAQWIQDRIGKPPATLFASAIAESIASYGYGTFTAYSIGRALQKLRPPQLASVNRLPGRVTSYTLDFSK